MDRLSKRLFYPIINTKKNENRRGGEYFEKCTEFVIRVIKAHHIPALSDDQSLNLCVKSNIKTWNTPFTTSPKHRYFWVILNLNIFFRPKDGEWIFLFISIFLYSLILQNYKYQPTTIQQNSKSICKQWFVLFTYFLSIKSKFILEFRYKCFVYSSKEIIFVSTNQNVSFAIKEIMKYNNCGCILFDDFA